MIWANRNGFFYVLDRTNGRFLFGHAVREGQLGERARRQGTSDRDAAAAGQPTWPGNQGGTNWYSPSFSPRTGLFYVSAWEGYASIFRKEPADYVARPQLRRRRRHRAHAGARRARSPHRPLQPDQQLDRRRRPRHCHGASIRRRASRSGRSSSTTSPTAAS